jgi:hypothetical protein
VRGSSGGGYSNEGVEARTHGVQNGRAASTFLGELFPAGCGGVQKQPGVGDEAQDVCFAGGDEEIRWWHRLPSLEQHPSS